MLKLVKYGFLALVWAGALGGIWYAGELVLLRLARHSWFLSGPAQSRASRHDPELGWTGAPSVRIEDFAADGGAYTTNTRGFRALEEYGNEKPPGTYRVLCLGDSFTDGTGVGDRQTYSFQLGKLDPRLQVINMGKGAYGIDQAILRYERDAKGLRADLVILAMIHDDIDRALSDRFHVYLPKPRFVLTDSGGFDLVGTPVPNFRTSTFNPFALFHKSGVGLVLRRLYFKKWGLSDPNELAPALFDRFRRVAAERGQEAALAYLPVVMHVTSGGEAPEIFEYRELIKRYAQRTKTPLADLTQAFLDLPADELSSYFLNDYGGHYSPRGHRLVADEIARQLDFSDRVDAVVNSTR